MRFAKWTAGCLVTLVAYSITHIGFLGACVMISAYIWFYCLISLAIFHYWIFKIKKVLRIYAWEYREPVRMRSHGISKYRRVIVRLGEQGGYPWTSEMVARNPLSATGWAKEMESGVWFAGDLPFGGVIAKPRGEEPMFMQPQPWAEMSSERESADRSRVDLAKRAKIFKRCM